MFEKCYIFTNFVEKLMHILQISINRTLDLHKVLQNKAPLMSMFSRSKYEKVYKPTGLCNITVDSATTAL
jgi:hypothetical protein